MHACVCVCVCVCVWTVVKEGHVILITAHIDDFIIACADRKVLDEFRTALLQRFEGTYEGEVHTYLGCEILRELEVGKTLLSQKHYAEDVLRTYDYLSLRLLGLYSGPYSYDTRQPSDKRAM